MYQPISLDGLIFYDIGNTAGFRISVYHKNIDRTEAVCIYAVEAACCRQRILRAGFFFIRIDSG